MRQILGKATGDVKTAVYLLYSRSLAYRAGLKCWPTIVEQRQQPGTWRSHPRDPGSRNHLVRLKGVTLGAMSG